MKPTEQFIDFRRTGRLTTLRRFGSARVHYYLAMICLLVVVQIADYVVVTNLIIHTQFEQGQQLRLVTMLLTLGILLLAVPVLFRPMERRIQEREDWLREEVRLNQEVNMLLLRSQADLNAVMGSVPCGIMVIDQDRRIRSANPSAKRIMLHIMQRELTVGSLINDYISPEDYSDFEQNFSRASRGEHVKFTKTLRLKDSDEEESYWLQYYPIFSPDQQVMGIGFSLEDVTPLRRAEAALRQSETRFRQLVEQIDQVFWLADPHELRLVYVSPAFEKVYGFSAEVLEGNPENLAPWIHPDDRALFMEHQQRRKNGHSDPLEYRIVRPDSETRYLWSRVFPILDESRVVQLTAGLTEDITERKHAEEQAIQFSFERERMQILSRFISSASHEFRTPLAVIDSSLYLLDRTLTDEKQRQRTARIREQSDYLLRLVEALTMMLMLDNTPLIETQPLDMDNLLSGVIASLQARASERKQRVEPQLEAHAQIMGDSSWLHHAFMQLVENALQFTPQGGQVRVRSMTQDDHVIVEIDDSGTGIPPEHLPHIFERFYRADTTHSTRGIGLGLPIARRIVELHSGTISVESTPNAGSRFRVTLRKHG